MRKFNFPPIPRNKIITCFSNFLFFKMIKAAVTSDRQFLDLNRPPSSQLYFAVVSNIVCATISLADLPQMMSSPAQSIASSSSPSKQKPPIWGVTLYFSSFSHCKQSQLAWLRFFSSSRIPASTQLHPINADICETFSRAWGRQISLCWDKFRHQKL